MDDLIIENEELNERLEIISEGGEVMVQVQEYYDIATTSITKQDAIKIIKRLKECFDIKEV